MGFVWGTWILFHLLHITWLVSQVGGQAEEGRQLRKNLSVQVNQQLELFPDTVSITVINSHTTQKLFHKFFFLAFIKTKNRGLLA